MSQTEVREFTFTILVELNSEHYKLHLQSLDAKSILICKKSKEENEATNYDPAMISKLFG